MPFERHQLLESERHLPNSSNLTIRVLLLSKFLGPFILRQTPGGSGKWGDCQFIVNGPPGAYDRVIVYDTMAAPADVTCPPNGILFVAGEPPAIKHYHPSFLAQFARVVVQDSDTSHPRLIDTHGGQPWFVGIAAEKGKPPKVTLTFEDLAAARPKKTGLLSVVAALRNVTDGHRARVRLAETLQKRFGDDVTVFGRDTKPFADKWDVLAPFKYHVALENSRYPHYFTEKLTDTYLADCFPLYWGCPNASDYFDPAGFRAINIHDPEGAADTIARAIDDGLWEKTRDIRAADRERVLNEHNLFALLARLCSEPVREAPALIHLTPEQVFQETPLRRLRKKLQRAVPRGLRPNRWKV